MEPIYLCYRIRADGTRTTRMTRCSKPSRSCEISETGLVPGRNRVVGAGLAGFDSGEACSLQNLLQFPESKLLALRSEQHQHRERCRCGGATAIVVQQHLMKHDASTGGQGLKCACGEP